ncbi:mucin-associated surface protein (MASP), putative, partial [Trypanosoma cruzi]
MDKTEETTAEVKE